MPIKSKKTPPGLDKAMARVGDLKRRDPRVGEAFEKVRKDPRNRTPHPIYTVSLGDLAGDAGLSAATQVGWRLLSQGASGSDFSFELTGDDKGDKFDLSLVNEGRFVSGTRRMLKELDLRKEVKQRDYTFAALRIPALYVVALWLQPDDNTQPEMIIPIEPTHPALEASKIYSPEEFHEALRKPAAEMIKTPTAPEPEGEPPTTPPGAGEGLEKLEQKEDAGVESEPPGGG